jgi:site-specific DNA-methyltransferase (adenine-specific)
MVDHRRHYSNMLYQGDNLDLIRSLRSGCIDLCIIDPPFFTGRKLTGSRLAVGRGGRRRSKGETGGGEGGEERFSFNDNWKGDAAAYLDWLATRLAGIVDLLKPEGALVVHLDWRMAHYVKVLLDGILGRDRFVNEIVWHYSSGGGYSPHRLARKHDTILWYARGDRFTCNRDAASLPRNRCRLCGGEVEKRNHMRREKDEAGRPVRTIRSNGKIYRYYDDDPAPPTDVWLDISHLQQRDPERSGYPTQKPLALLERLVRLCSNPGDLVADFFMGTGTALEAAARHGRKWLGCDISPEAVAIAGERLARYTASPAVTFLENSR